MKTRENRQFGWIVAGFTGLLFLVRGLHRGKWSWELSLVSVSFLTLASLFPGSLEKPRKFWLALGEWMSRLTHPLILGVVFYGVLTPMGFLRRKLGHSKIEISNPGSSSQTTGSFWIRCEPDAKPVNRERLRRQF